jgi:hypothetical protein
MFRPANWPIIVLINSTCVGTVLLVLINMHGENNIKYILYIFIVPLVPEENKTEATVDPMFAVLKDRDSM